MKKLTLIATLISLSLLLTEGCNKHSSDSVNAPLVPKEDPSRVEVYQGSSKDFTQPIRFKNNVGIHVKGSGPTIIISIQNQGQETIELIPQNFALVTGPNKETDLIIITPGSADLSNFAPILLNPGGQATRRLTMTAVSDVSGAKFMLFYPQKGIQLMVPVE